MPQRVLVLGSVGMLGHLVAMFLRQMKDYEVLNLARNSQLDTKTILCDIRDSARLRDIIETEKPDAVVNCIGILVNTSDREPREAIFANAYFPHLLRTYTEAAGARLIHVSTDCVFSGDRGAYRATDKSDADDVYGRSKALGEIVNDHDATLRTSIIGPELKPTGEGLMHWFLTSGPSVQGFRGAIWSGVTTLQLAKAIETTIRHGYTGLHHVTNGMVLSKFHLLEMVRDAFGLWEYDIYPDDTYRIDKSLVPSEQVNFDVPPYSIMLQELRDWMWEHRALYEHLYPNVYKGNR
jgi:dTDP-4-dehydrorhamnose reductase